MTNRDITTSDKIIDAVIPKQKTRASTRETVPFPLIALNSKSDEGGLLHLLSRLDESGRINNGRLLDELRWKPGDYIDVSVLDKTIIAKRSNGGLFTVTARRSFTIPYQVRVQCGIQPGDDVLITASCERGVLLVNTISTLETMIFLYYSKANRRAATS